jgi:hypothetical protein
VGHPVLYIRVPVSYLELADTTLAEKTGLDPFGDCEFRDAEYGRCRRNHGLAALKGARRGGARPFAYYRRIS